VLENRRFGFQKIRELEVLKSSLTEKKAANSVDLESA